MQIVPSPLIAAPDGAPDETDESFGGQEVATTLRPPPRAPHKLSATQRQRLANLRLNLYQSLVATSGQPLHDRWLVVSPEVV